MYSKAASPECMTMLTTGYAGTTCMYLAHHELESLLLLLIQQGREDTQWLTRPMPLSQVQQAAC